MSRSRPPAALTAPVSERPFWSQVLRALRDGQGVSRDGWAAVLGYGRTTVQRWETGENVPDAAAEEAIIAHCRDRGLFQAYDRRCLGGFALTPESLSALLAAARLGSRFMEQTADSTEHSGDLRTNLPYALTSFVGRDRELTAISELLAQTRLLTLAGPGGVGKTRLAMEVGHALLDRYPDGVWLVDLAPLTDGALVPQAAATAVNVRERPGRPVVDALIDGISDRRLLLVLDNCEHLVAASADLAERVLRACAGVQVLATSREVLGVGGETVVRVPALSVPDASMPAPLGRLAHYDAVRLFVERVRARQLSFALTDATASAVVRVSRRLDGIPLALELAASRVPALSVEQIAGRLDDSFRMLRLLAGGSRATPSRQQTLRGTLDWSYELLSDRERELLCRLAVFAGDFPLDAAEAVGSGDAIGTDEVLDLLSQLIDKSLVNVEQVAGVRYRLLETVRQFALEKLEPDDQAAIRDRHCGWYLALAEEAEPNLVGPEQRVWLAQLEREHDNLRAALAGADECGDAMSLLRLTGALWRFWEVRGHFAEGRSWLERALAGGDDAPARVRAKALTGAGLLARLQDDCPRALHCYEEALALYRSANDGQGTATTLIHLGVVAQRQGQAEQAVCWYEEGLALCQELGDQRRSAITLANLGTLAQQQGKLDEAAVRQDAALALFRRIGDQGGVALALGGLGNVEVERGNYAHAATLIEEALSLFQSLGDQRRIAIGFVNLGDVERARANRGRALRHYAEALRLNRQLGQKEGIAYCLEGAGGVVLDGGDLEPAARLFGAAAALRDSIGIQRPPAERVAYDADVARLRDGLSTEAFNSAWASGGVESTDNAFERWTATTEAAIEADRIETRTEGGR